MFEHDVYCDYVQEYLNEIKEGRTNQMVDMNEVESIRTELGIPKTIMAKKCKVSVNTYYNWIKDPSSITAQNAQAMAEALKITEPDRLLAIFFMSDVQTNVSN